MKSRLLPPVRNLSGTVHGGDAEFDLVLGGVDDPGGGVGHLHELAGLHFVVPLFVHGGAAVGAHEARGLGFLLLFHFGDELGHGLCALGVGLTEGDAGATVEGKHLGGFFAQHGEEGGITLHAEDEAAVRGAESVDDVVVGDAVLAGGGERLELIHEGDQQVLGFALGLRFVEPHHGVGVEEQLEVGVDVAALGLEGLRHGGAEDTAFIHIMHLDGVRFIGAEDLHNVGMGEEAEHHLQGADETFFLLSGLGIEEGLVEVLRQSHAVWRAVGIAQLIEEFLHLVLVRQELVGAEDIHGPAEFFQQFKGAGECLLGGGFEEGGLLALSQRGTGIHEVLRVGGVGQAFVGDEVVALLGLPGFIEPVRAHHEHADIIGPTMAGEVLQGKEVLVTFRTEDQPAPVRPAHADLMQQRIETRGRLAHAGVPRDQPVTGELARQPLQVLVLDDVVLLGEVGVPFQQHEGRDHTDKGHTPRDFSDRFILKDIPDAKSGDSSSGEEFEERKHAR